MNSRPVTSFTLALNYALGGLDVIGYHIVNIAIHLICALALYAFMHRMLRQVRSVRISVAESGGLAFAVALLWMVHPLVSECVNYTTQRSDSLMGCFYLLTLYCAAKGFEGGAGKWYGGAVLCSALGMASKESMVSAPLVVLLYDRTFYARSFVGALRGHPWLYGGLAVTWLVLVRGLSVIPHGATIGFDRGTSAWTYALNQCQMLWIYLHHSFWPHPLLLDYGYPRELSLQDVWLEAMAIGVLLVLTVVALRRWPLWGFAGAWFFMVLAPTSSFVPIVTEVGAERRMYLPLAVVVALVVVVVYLALRKIGVAYLSLVGGGLVAGLALVLGYATMQRNADYKSTASIWHATTAVVPDNPRVRYNLGRAYMEQGLYGWALEQYAEALRLQPNYPEALLNMGATHYASGSLDAAADAYVRAVMVRPTYAAAWENLAYTYYEMGQFEAMRIACGELLRLESSDSRRAKCEALLRAE